MRAPKCNTLTFVTLGRVDHPITINMGESYAARLRYLEPDLGREYATNTAAYHDCWISLASTC
jgi:hypothetical protein